ncbi:MAG TPA: hypothetical protein VN380_17290 [Thermoanaerobaculia bacterium]|jgi:hypothetical protein|nr:hypothetical protein [Thermoanaerobaculia bacterium]
MDIQSTLGDVYRTALAEHGDGSMWTQDAESSFSLDEWWDNAQRSEGSEQRLFTYDGTRIVRHGADVQDQSTVIYRAGIRCASCKRFVQEEPGQFNRRRLGESQNDLPIYCIRCVSGGVIGPHLFRKT